MVRMTVCTAWLVEKVSATAADGQEEPEPRGPTVMQAPGVVIPVPARATACGLPGALSVMLIEADRTPVAVGLKVTVRTQLALGCKLFDPQVLV